MARFSPAAPIIRDIGVRNRQDQRATRTAPPKRPIPSPARHPRAADGWARMPPGAPPRRSVNPGPPPPCGMQNVLCRRWQTSAPIVAGDVADLGVHIGAVHVDLTAMSWINAADVADRRLEHAMAWTDTSPSAPPDGRGAAQPWRAGRPGRCCRPDRSHHHHTQPRHRRAGRIGAMRGRRDQAHIARVLAARCVYARIANSPEYSPCDPAFGCSVTRQSR